MGPNGAGKTHAGDAVTGLVPATGSVTKSGVELLGQKVHKDRPLGRRTHLPDRVGVRGPHGPAEPRHRRRRRTIRADTAPPPQKCPAADRGSPRYDRLTDLRDCKAGILPHGQKQWLEIGMLLVQDADVLLLRRAPWPA
ncbi:hypothetical protein GS416_03650 [Rhodococcus hoagii]|nr:hypothetical protein [Prescottella equi]